MQEDFPEIVKKIIEFAKVACNIENPLFIYKGGTEDKILEGIDPDIRSVDCDKVWGIKPTDKVVKWAL